MRAWQWVVCGCVACTLVPVIAWKCARRWITLARLALRRRGRPAQRPVERVSYDSDDEEAPKED